MANGRDERILDLRQQGLNAQQQAPNQLPTATTQPTVNIDPLGMGADAYGQRMAELREFQRTDPTLQHQRESALAFRQPTERARAETLAQLSSQRMAQESQERLAAIQAGSQRFSPISTGGGAVVVDRATGETQQIGGPPAPSFADIEQQQNFLSELYAERGQLLSDNPNANTRAIDARIRIQEGVLDRAQGISMAQPQQQTDDPAIMSKFDEFEARLQRPLTDAEKAQIRQRMGQ